MQHEIIYLSSEEQKNKKRELLHFLEVSATSNHPEIVEPCLLGLTAEFSANFGTHPELSWGNALQEETGCVGQAIFLESLFAVSDLLMKSLF